jgi:3-phosphoglycerate kinase
MVLCSYPDSHLIYPPQSKYGDQIELGKKLLEKYSDRIGLPVDVALDKNGVHVSLVKSNIMIEHGLYG